MKKFALFALAATLLASTPVVAQGISIGPGGVSVGVDRDRDRSRTIIRERRGPDRVIVRDRRDDDDDDCRTVTIRERDRFGNRVTKKIRRC